MKVAILILLVVIGLNGCTTTRDHKSRDKSSSPVVKVLPPDLARELGDKGGHDHIGESDVKKIVFAVAIDKYGRITFLRSDNGKLTKLESTGARSQRSPSLTDSSYPMSPNLSVRILTPEAEKELEKLGLENVQQMLVSDVQPRELVSDSACKCPSRTKVKIRGIDHCKHMDCDEEDEWF